MDDELKRIDQAIDAIKIMQADIERLRSDCEEAYQVVGTLSHMAGVPDTDATIRALDNLAAAAAGEPRKHESMLPFPTEE